MMEVADKNGQEIAESYLSSLVDLTTNSKPLINMLTMLAEENVEHGQTICDAVQQHITKVDPDFKLPILYLIDSIVKNVGGVYTTLFSRLIVNIFVAVFEKVNEHVRQKMFQLRRTWDGVFPLSRLHMLDYQISKIDPNWPTSQPTCNTTKIHLNPKFPVGETEKNLQTELQIKQRELLELKKKKLELELAATQKQLCVIPGIGAGVGMMEVPANQLSNHVYTPSISAVVSAPTPPLRLDKIVPSTPVYVPDMHMMVPPVTTVPSGPTNVRQKIAPANAALIQSMRVRDPRLLRQPTSISGQNTSQLLPTDHMYNHKSISEANGPLGPIPRINNNHIMNNNNNNVHRNQRIQCQSFSNDTTTSKFSNNNSTSSDTDNKHNTKSSRSSSSHKRPKSQNSKSGNSKTSSSSTKGGGSSSKGDARSSRTASSSSSASKKLSSSSSKNRKDDKSPQRKKSSSRHRSPTSNRRSPTPPDTTKSSSSSRSKSSSTSSTSSSSYHNNNNNKLKTASSTSSDKHKDSHSKDKSNCNSNFSNNKKSSTTMSAMPSSTMSPTNHKQNRAGDYTDRLRHSRSKSPSMLHSIVDGCSAVSKDIDLRAQLSAPINLISNQLTPTPTTLQTNTSTVLNTTTAPLIATIAANMVGTDQNSSKNSDTCGKSFLDEATKDIDFRVAMAIPGIATNQPSKSIEAKKRGSIDERENEEPKGKKTRTSEKIDVLFGTEDVDLRIPPVLNPITSSAALTDDDTTTKGHQPNKTTKSKPKRHDIDLRKRDILNENAHKSNSDNAKLTAFLAQDECGAGIFNMTHKSKKSTTKPPSNNQDAAFSSGSDDESLKQSHRVPKRRRTDSEKSSPNKLLTHVSSNRSPVADAPPKERRVRKTKWNSPWEDQNKVAAIAPIPAIPTIPFAALGRTAPATLTAPHIPATDNNLRQFSSRSVPETTIWQPNVTPLIGPASATVNPLGLITGVPPSIPPPMPPTTPMLANTNMPVVVAQSSLTIGNCPIKERTINIDGIAREIRFYNEIAIAFMEKGGKEPKEIGFQSGERRLCVDNTEQIILAFNDTYKPILINNKQYQIRFGSPTRELYIDNEWYECYFGDPPVHILLDNELHVFRIDGPAPQVRIGNLRMDLVVGKVDMYIGTTTKVTLFLDGQLQIFEANNQQHTIQFADSFLTVIIDNVEFPNVRYGGMPDKYCFGNAMYHIRFSVLPKDVVPGKTFVRNMKRTKNHPELDLSTTAMPQPPILSTSAIAAAAAAATATAVGALNSTNIGVTVPVTIPPVTGPILPLMSIQTQGPDLLAGTSNPSTSASNQQTNTVPVISKTDINNLFQQLLATGIINTPNVAGAGGAGVTKSPPTPRERDPIVVPVSLRRPDTLKKRQAAIVKTLFSGVQCGDCGIRFPTHETQKYGQHLDWHYRQNRREKDSAKKASSRKWYYGISDWIQYEEIENLEERERNFFETQKDADGDATNGDSAQRSQSPAPSCVAGSDDHNRTCDMCHDLFETFYNEETEEWHLRNAVRIEGNTYHPVCYEDYKASLTLDESNLNVPHIGDISTADDNAVDMEMKDETKSLGLSGGGGDERIPVLDDDDDVIVLPQDEPVITEIPDDDEPKSDTSRVDRSNECVGTKCTEPNGATTTAAGCSQSSDVAKDHNDSDVNEDGNHNESDVQILEPHISIMNLDEYDESKALSATLDESNIPVKIKQEPKYEGYDDPDEDDGFEDVGTFEEDPIELIDEGSVDEYVATVVSSQPTLIASIDGNVELHEAQPPTIGTNKIKINITKNVQLNKNSINSSELDDNLAINNRELKSATVGLSTGQTENSENYVANDTDDLTSGQQATASTTTNKNDGGDGGDADDGSRSASMDARHIEYEVKESIKHVQFKRQPIVRSESVETSGLCSIM